jgi:hypothetical protein
MSALPEYQPRSVRVKGFAEEEMEFKRKGYNEAGLLYHRQNWLYEDCDMGRQHWLALTHIQGKKWV